MSDGWNPKKVAIVGGGCAAMAAAWDLTSPDNPDRCDVTIFQMGGRLGGKGASSRNTRAGYGDRIEEHGLHLWLGYYENAFRMIRTCFEELSKARDGISPSGQTIPPEIQAYLDQDPFDNWNWLSAFERASLVGLADDSSGDWVPWVARFPETVFEQEDGVTGFYRLPDGSVRPGVHLVDDPARAYPGEKPRRAQAGTCDDGQDECLERPNVAFFLTHALRELQAFMDSLVTRVDQLCAKKEGVASVDPDELLNEALAEVRPAAPGAAQAPPDVARALRTIRLVLLVPAIEAVSTVARIAEGPLPYQNSPLVAILDHFIDAMRERIEMFVQHDAAARRIWELIDLLAANIRGIVAAGLEGADDFSRLDEWNYLDWLRMNRIAERTLNSPIIRGAHDLGFAYVDGDPRDPQIAAGQALSAGCRFLFMYKGALFWRMKAGMGDVVFAPMYLALRNRGVKFRFFHRLDDIVLDEAGQAVTGLKFWRQVALKVDDESAATNYEPLISVCGLAAWRRTPDCEQFAFDDAVRSEYDAWVAEDEGRSNFESVWCNWTHGEDVSASVGDGADYDAAIVTVPVAALRRVSKQVASSPTVGERWTKMLDNIGTVATQCVQLWVNKTTRDLGWTDGQVSFSAFVHPFDTWADLSHLVDAEAWEDGTTEAGQARGVHYFCSVLPERQIPWLLRAAANRERVDLGDRKLIEEAQDTVRSNVRYFLDEWIFHLWPDAVYRYPTDFKWELLVDPGARSGPDRLEGQHVVANIDPSERYTLSLPGTTKYRLPPDVPVVARLFVAGDWTDCGLNIGCVEAAVMSGRLASSGVSGYPNARLIPGFCKRTDRVIEMQGGY